MQIIEHNFCVAPISPAASSWEYADDTGSNPGCTRRTEHASRCIPRQHLTCSPFISRLRLCSFVWSRGMMRCSTYALPRKAVHRPGCSIESWFARTITSIDSNICSTVPNGFCTNNQPTTRGTSTPGSSIIPSRNNPTPSIPIVIQDLHETADC
jgi:hypothetical protein